MNIEELYRTYFDIVYRYIRSVSQDGSLAEEVTQETFFKALKKADQFRGDCDVRVWLCQIAKNTLYDHLKKQKKQLLGDEQLETAESAWRRASGGKAGAAEPGYGDPQSSAWTFGTVQRSFFPADLRRADLP